MSFNAWLPFIIPILLGLVTPVVLLVKASRQFSGQVATTDAAKLWDESTRMRDEYRARINELQGVIHRCEARIAELEARNDMVEKENNNLQNVIAKLEHELRQRIAEP